MSRSAAITTVLLAALTASGCASQTAGKGDAGWITLIDGASGLDNWTRVGDANWRVVDGAIHADQNTDKANSFLLSKNSYADFQIRAEFWVSDDANSGIYMRCSEPNSTRRAS